MHATEYNKKIYWDSRAASYPRPFDPSIIRKTRKRLKELRDAGIVFRNKDFLDIGCGSGIYSLALHHSCRTVTGIDSSDAMLENFRTEAVSRHILNASCINAEWGQVPESEIYKKFDIVLASMTAAVQTYEEVLKMETAAREWCVYIGWAGERHNALLEKIYEHHGVQYLPPPGAENITSALDRAGHRYEIRFLYDAWFKIKTVDDTLADLTVNIKVNDGVFDEEWTRKFLESKAVNGMVRQKTRVRKAVIIWKPQ